jgi:AraC-like DNA-binding protein
MCAIDEAHAAVAGAPPAVQALRDHLATHRGRATLAIAARALGVSSRTLQLQLTAAGTTFRREANASCIRAAQRLLVDGDTKIAAIAAEVGCASVQHFSTLFRKHTGSTPGEWRVRHRIR